MSRRVITQGFMVTDYVVVYKPLIGNGLDLSNVIEQIGIQDFIAIGSVKSFDEGVLIRFSGLYVSDMNVVDLRPIHELLGGHFRPIIQTNGLWLSVVIDQAFQRAYQPGRWNGRPDIDSKTFAVGFIDHVECAKCPAAVQRVVHEIQSPAIIDVVSEI